MKKGVRLVVILSFALILTFSLVSANIFTDFFNNLFGGNNRGEGVNLSPEESLAAYYSFDDGTAKDNSGNGNDGTLRNGVSFTSGILDKGKAAYFDGADDFVRVDELNINDKDDFSVSYWIKPEFDYNSGVNRGSILWLQGTGNSKNPTYFAVNHISNADANVTSFLINSNDANNWAYAPVSFSEANQQWIHIVGVFDYFTRNISLYANGVKIAEKHQTTKGVDGDGILWIGKVYNDYFKGSIDEVKIFKKALNDEEIDLIYKELLPPIKCSSNDDCPSGQICNDGICIEKIKQYNINVSVATLKNTYNVGEKIELTDPPEENQINEDNVNSNDENIRSISIIDNKSGNIYTKQISFDKKEYVLSLQENKLIYHDPNNIEIEGESLIPKYNGYIVEFQELPVLKKKVELEKQAEKNKESLGYKIFVGRPFILTPNKVQEEVNSYKKKITKDNVKIKNKILNILSTSDKSNDFKILNEYSTAFNGIALDVSDEEAKEIEKIEGIKKVYPNYEVHTTLMDSVPLINTDTVWQQVDDNDNSVTGKNVTIAIIDTGVDYTHPDLGGCLGENCKVIGGYDFVNSDNDPMDDQGHGTHVAGIAVGGGKIIKELKSNQLFDFDISQNKNVYINISIIDGFLNMFSLVYSDSYLKLFQGTGERDYKKLVVSDKDTITLDRKNNTYFVASWSNNINTESHILKIRYINYKDPDSFEKSSITLSNLVNNDNYEGKVGDTINIGNLELVVVSVDENDVATIKLGDYGVNSYFNKIYNTEGNYISLPLEEQFPTNEINLNVYNIDDNLVQSHSFKWNYDGIEHFFNSYYTIIEESLIPFIGVAPDAKIIAYKVLNSQGLGSMSTVISGIERAVDPNDDGNFSDHVDIISMSLGTDCSWYGGYSLSCGPDDAVSKAVDTVVDAGVVAVIAAGNSGPNELTIGSPGTARKAITVGATYKKDYEGLYWKDINPRVNQITSFSSRGLVIDNNLEFIIKPDIVAPGALICATRYDSIFPEGTHRYYQPCVDDKHVLLAGTSMATPVVSGVVALIKQAHPEWTPEEIKASIKNTAINIGYDENTQGAGLINPLEAIGIDIKAVINPRNEVIKINPTQNPSLKSQTYSILNRNDGTLSFDISAEINQPGIIVSTDRSNVIINSGVSESFNLLINVDIDKLKSNTYYKGFLIATLGDYKLKVPFYVYVNDRITSDTESFDLGFDNPSLQIWNAEKEIRLTNIRNDKEQHYEAKVVMDKQEYYSGKKLKHYENIFEDDNILYNYFILSSNYLDFAPLETKSIRLSAEINNQQIPNGVYYGRIILNSDLDKLEIPFKFTKYYTLIINNSYPETQFFYNGYLMNNDKSYNFNDYLLKSPIILYLDEKNNYEVILSGEYSGSNAPIVDYIKRVNMDGITTPINVDFSEAKNSLLLNVVDKNGELLPKNIDGILILENEINGNFVGGISFYYWESNGKIRKFSDLPPSLSYRISFGNICTTNDFYSVSTKISEINSDYVIHTNPENYKRITAHFNSPFLDELNIFGFNYGITINEGIGIYCGYGDKITSSETKELYLTNGDKLTDTFNLIKLKDPFDITGINEIKTPRLEAINDKLRKSEYDNKEGILLEESLNDNIYLSMGPEYWRGKINVNNFLVGVIATKDSSQGYFRDQDLNIINNDDIHYTIKFEDGSVEVKGLIKGGPLNFILSKRGVYTFKLEDRGYVINGEKYLGKVTIKFDTSASESNPPYFEVFKLLCNGVPCDTLSTIEQSKLRFKINPNEGLLNSVKVFVKQGEGWNELVVGNNEEIYESIIPILPKGEATLKIVGVDDSGNSLEYEFSFPVEEKISKPQSKIVNNENLDISGTLRIYIQIPPSKEGEEDEWIGYLNVIDEPITIPANDLFKLDGLFNPKNIILNEVGHYRIKTEFTDSSGNKYESTWEFSVV